MTIPLLILSLLTFAQSTEVKIQQNDILTSKAWLEDSENPIKKLVHIFHKNGEYTIEGDKLVMNGKWLWSDKNELFVLFEGIKFDTLSHQFPQGLASQIPGYYLRIILLNDKELKTLQRYEGDSWDSGFTEELTYIAQEL